jgi:hypothetical protein
MFDRKIKAITWVLAFVMAILIVNPVKAVRDHGPRVMGEEEIIAELRSYKNANHSVLRKIKHILNKIEKERFRWSPCLLDGETGIYAIENGHSELYCLWLMEKLSRIADALDGEKSVFWKLCDFMGSLMGFVKEREPMIYYFHEELGCTAAQIRGCLVKIPGRYNFTKLKELRRWSLSRSLLK